MYRSHSQEMCSKLCLMSAQLQQAIGACLLLSDAVKMATVGQ